MGLRASFAFVPLRLGIRSRAKELEVKMLKMEKENSLKLSRQKQVFDRKLRARYT